MKLRKNDTIGIISCSNGRDPSKKVELEQVKRLLEERFAIRSIEAKTVYRIQGTPYSGTKKERANELIKLYQNPKIKVIFDVSGGDLANEILPYLDFNLIRTYAKPFVGYSDLTSIINPIYQKTGVPGYLFLLQNIIHSKTSLNAFQETFINDNGIPIIGKRLTQGKKPLQGTLIGGNIRCLLKLAGTPYFPEIKNKILLLESLSGTLAKQAAYIAQYEQLGVLKQCQGILLGQFTEAEKAGEGEEICQSFIEIGERYHIPITKTTQIGHSLDSIPVLIGGKISVHSVK